MPDRVTLSLRTVDGSEKSGTTNIMYVNPEATDSQLRSLAEHTVALTSDTLVSSSRIETREIPNFGTTSRNLTAEVGVAYSGDIHISGNSATIDLNALWSGKLFYAPCISFNYYGYGKVYVKSRPYNFVYSSNMIYDLTAFNTNGCFPDGTWKSTYITASCDGFCDATKFTNEGLAWEGDVVLALDGDDTYEYTEFIIHYVGTNPYANLANRSVHVPRVKGGINRV